MMIDGIIIQYEFDIIYNIIAGATPNDIISASESIVSPNDPMECVLNLRANVPSIQSNTTASSSSCAEAILLPFSIKNIASSPHIAFAMDAISAMVIIFNILVSILS